MTQRSSRTSINSLLPTAAGHEKILNSRFALERRVKEHSLAMSEVESGMIKTEKWIWWEFPALENYTRDRKTPSLACLNGLEDALRYINVPTLKQNLIEILIAASDALERHSNFAPYTVFDSYKRKSRTKGDYRTGPRNSFKVRAAVTLVAAAAFVLADYELHDLCLDVLSHFKGDLSYTDWGSGSIMVRKGIWSDTDGKKVHFPLVGCDRTVLKIIAQGCQECKELVTDDICFPMGEEEEEGDE